MLPISVSPDSAASGATRNAVSDWQLSPPNQEPWIILCGLVHDLRQPLSIVEICADYLNLILPAGELRARQQVEVLQQQVVDASRLLCDALRLCKLSQERAVATSAAASRSSMNRESSAVT
jgi:hypothetical protein